MFVTEMMTAIVCICLFFLIKKNPYCIYFYMCIECLHVACRWCLSVFIYASFLCLRLILFFHIHLYYILSCMCDYANLHCYTYVFIFVFVSIYSERTFCAFSLCGCTHVLPPADSPPSLPDSVTNLHYGAHLLTCRGHER